jgi:hypothetical protein
MLPIALKAVQLQLQAMGASRYELGVRVPQDKSEDGKSQMILRNNLTNGEVFEKLDWLASENAKGHHIYIRPSGLSQLSLIDDLNRDSLKRLIDTGYTPACVVETSPGNFQAWLKHAWSLTAQEGTVSATHPSGMESPQRPRTLSKELRSNERYDFARREKALTVARRWPEKRDAGKGRSKASGSGFSLCM